MSATAARPIPRAVGHRVLGSALQLAAGPHRFVADTGRLHGGLAAFRVLHRPFLAVTDAEYVRHVLVTHHDRYQRSYHYENPILGKGLLTTDGPVWLKRRRQVSPAFRRDALERLVPLARRETERLLARWEEHARLGRPAPLGADMMELAISVIGKSLLSAEVSPEEAARFGATVRHALSLLRRRNNSLFRAPRWAPTRLNRGLRASRRALDDFLRPIIAAHRADPGARGDLVDALLAVRDPETGDALDDGEVLDETKTLFGAGFETTATALTWTLYLLARHPEVAERWHAELDRELGGRPPEWADLERLRFTGNVVSESLRLFPPVYNAARECVVPDSIDGYPIPRGTVLLLSILGVHRDPRHWAEPDAFRPERFEGEWPRRAFLPFATGKHQCIGNHFALTEIAVSLALIGQRFRLALADPAPVEPVAQITLVPSREIPLRLTRR